MIQLGFGFGGDGCVYEAGCIVRCSVLDASGFSIAVWEWIGPSGLIRLKPDHGISFLNNKLMKNKIRKRDQI